MSAPNDPRRVLTNLLHILEFVEKNIRDYRPAKDAEFIQQALLYKDTVQAEIKKFREQGVEPLTDDVNSSPNPDKS